MKITLEQAVSGFNALQHIGGEKLPIKLAYTIQRNMRLLQPDVKAYDEQRVNLIKSKYGEKKDEDNWQVKPEKLAAFSKEIEALASVEIELDLRTIPLDSVNMSIAPNDLYALEWMFVEADPDTPKPPRKAHK
jgi:hypothetical protein